MADHAVAVMKDSLTVGLNPHTISCICSCNEVASFLAAHGSILTLSSAEIHWYSPSLLADGALLHDFQFLPGCLTPRMPNEWRQVLSKNIFDVILGHLHRHSQVLMLDRSVVKT